MPARKLNYRVKSVGKLNAILLSCTVIGFLLSPSSDVFAQEVDVLKGLNGNDAQEDAARLVDNTCPELVQPFDDGDLSAPQNQLVTVCSNMIVDQLRATGSNPDLLAALEGLGFDGYGLDAEGLNNALQGLNGEEIQAAQSRVTEVRGQQTQNIFSRLAAIRAGQVGGGVSVAGLNLEAGEEVYRPADLAPFDQDRYEIVPAAWLEDATWSRLGIFVTGGVTLGEKDTTGQSDAFDFNSLNFTVGADYRVADGLVVGAALGYNRFDADIDTTARSPAGENLDSDGYLISVFASQSWDMGLFVDGVASFGQDGYDSTRRIVIDSGNANEDSIDEKAEGDFDSLHYGVATNVGYEVEAGGFTVTPVARLEYVRAEFDGYTERGNSGLNLTFDDFDAESLRSQFGVEASYSISTDQGVIVPSLRAEYVHEFLNDDDGARVRFASGVDPGAFINITTEDVDRDYGLLGASLTSVSQGGMSAFVDYTTVVFLDDFEVHQIKAGIRWEF